MSDFWVFGYGSLMWNPGFEPADRHMATVHGFHRSLCVYSWVHRGTKESPGLVLGLDKGGSCRGVALKVPRKGADEIVAYLRERELVTDVYKEQQRPVKLDSGRRVEALVYVVDRNHEQYAGRLADEEIGRIVTGSQGRSGHNLEYVLNTVAHLRREGIFDPHLEAVADFLPRH